MANEIIPYDSNAENVVVYRTDDNSIQLQVKLEHESVWLTQDQMCALFGRERSVITKHINKVFEEGELPREGFVQILHKTSLTGGRPVTYYNLDVVISVGYRVKSVQGTRFRQWATRMLREMLLNRLDEVKQISKLTRRVDAIELDVKQLKGGMSYLVKQLSEPPPEPPRRRIGFGADEEETSAKPYARAKCAAKSQKGGAA